MGCGVGRRLGLDRAWLWLWYRPAATALIRPLAWEPPYAVRAAQEMAKRQKKKKKEQLPSQKATCALKITLRSKGQLPSPPEIVFLMWKGG